MQYLKRSISAFSVITLITTTFAAPALSQSGRGRPKVPQPTGTTSQPPPVIHVPAAGVVAKQEQSGTTSRFVLRNGITVIISENHSTPTAAAVAFFKASPVDEPWSMSAVARIAGRMILRGTVLRPGAQAMTDLRSLGASITAGTFYDGAAYSLLAPADKLKEALGVQADMLQNSAFEAETLRREVRFAAEQQKRPIARLDGALEFPSNAFSSRTFSAGSISQPGESASYSMARLFDVAFGPPPSNLDALRSLTRERLLEFYRSHYRPENLIVSVAGDVPTFNTLVEIQQLYGDFGTRAAKPAEQKGPEATKPKTASARPPAASPPSQQEAVKPEAAVSEQAATVKPWGTTEQGKLRYAADRADISQSIVSVGFHGPGTDSKEWPAIEVLTTLIGQGRGSRLNRALVDGSMAANRIESTYLAFAGSGLLTTQMWSVKDSREGSSIDRAESALFKELDILRREAPGDGELARAKSLLEKRFFDEISQYPGRARALARAEAAGVGLRAALDYRARIRSVSAEDVRRAAAKYLTLANTSIHEYEPLSAETRTFDSDSFATTVTVWAPGFAQQVEGGSVRAADVSASSGPVAQGSERSPERQAMLESVQPLPVRDYSTLNGPKAFVREDHSQPTVTVAILFQGGRLIEDAATSGTTETMLRTMLYGTTRRTGAQVTQELEELGADIMIVVEPDFFGFMLSSLSRNADRALKLLRDLIEDPAFRPEDLMRARLGQLASIRDARDSSFTRSRELLLQAMFAGHSYSLPPHGREEVVVALTAEKLREWYARAVGRQLPLAIIVGDTDGSALVSSQIADGFKRRDLDTAIQVRTPQQPAASEKIEQRRVEQTNFAIGIAGPKADSTDLTAVHVFESAMSGEGGRLFRELRDNQSLISTAALGVDSMFVTGTIAAHATTSPENEQRVRTALLAEFERIARAGLAADELAGARALAATSRLTLLQSQPHHAIQYARGIFYKQKAAEADNFAEQAANVTPDDVKRIASVYFKVSAACAGVVRGTSQILPTSPAKQN